MSHKNNSDDKRLDKKIIVNNKPKPFFLTRWFFFLKTTLMGIFLGLYKKIILILIILKKLHTGWKLIFLYYYFTPLSYFFFFDFYNIDFLTQPVFYKMSDKYLTLYQHYCARMSTIFIIINPILLLHNYLICLIFLKFLMKKNKISFFLFKHELSTYLIYTLKKHYKVLIKKNFKTKANYISSGLFPWEKQTKFQFFIKQKKCLNF